MDQGGQGGGLAVFVQAEDGIRDNWRDWSSDVCSSDLKMASENTLDGTRWAYAQTANAAVRRTAFDAVGGFEERIRSAGDADLCWRVVAAGWELEARPEIGRASCRERVEISVVAVSLKK